MLRGAQIVAFLVAMTTMSTMSVAGEPRPRLLLTRADLEQVTSLPPMPVAFGAAIEHAETRVRPFLGQLPDVPIPEQAGGGYSHEQHKRNAVTIQDAGVLYQLTGNRSYAVLARDLLSAYARMYPALPLHPAKKEQSSGKLFWQSLNEAVWLLTAIQGYDAIYESLSPTERKSIEDGLFHPLVRFLSTEAPQTFDRIHNHGTWAVAAVGMTGYVLDEPRYVEIALQGLKRDGSAGYYRQLDELFSPDGYYSEGPYYQRYALMPFVLFARAIQNNEPGRKIFEYRDGILLKAVEAAIQLTYAGLFFPINDALKDKGLDTTELCHGVSIAYSLTSDPRFLSIAHQQGVTLLTGDGYRVARALEAGDDAAFAFRSMQFRDGPNGDEGALSIIRSDSDPGHQALVFKATAQGMGHGHFDKLNWLFYDNGREIVTDYGAARFLNVEEKRGGHYLPENNSWAKQTVAHNTLVVDEASHFGANLALAEKSHPEPLVYEVRDDIQLTAARMSGAYPDVDFTRAMAMLRSPALARPVILDVMKVAGGKPRQYDLPLYYSGQITHVSHPVEASTDVMKALGKANGYQHLWLRGRAVIPAGETFQLTWLAANRFYTYSVLADAPLEVLFTEVGAGDPEFNLRKESGLVLRLRGAADATFFAVLEPHGEYDGTREFTTASASRIRGLARISKGGLDVFEIRPAKHPGISLALSYDPDPQHAHEMTKGDVDMSWSGFYQLRDPIREETE
jgi:hypothetical protein